MSYSEFRSEMESLAGFHRGGMLAIDERHTKDLSVHLHEDVHGRIFEETYDGMLHRCILAMLAKRDHAASAHLKALKIANDFLFEDTRIPHECAATFLGIIGLPTQEDMLIAQARLDKPYQLYFSYFGDVLPWKESSFASYVLAWSLTRFAFCSSRLKAVDSIDKITPELLMDIDGPERRMDLGLSQLSSMSKPEREEFLRDFFWGVMDALDIRRFDALDDGQWKARIMSGASDTAALDEAVCEAFENVLTGATGSSMPKRIKIPVYLEEVTSRLRPRRFSTRDFSLSNERPYYPPQAASHYARLADINVIRRRDFTEFHETSAMFSLNWIAKTFSEEICIIFVQVQAGMDSFKLFVTAMHEGEINYAPGTGLILELSQVARYFEWLSDLVIDKGHASPLSYIIYLSSDDGDSEMRIWVPNKDNSTNLFLSHLRERRKLAQGQGVMLRPLLLTHHSLPS